jgi:hypothetical protein
MCSCFLLEQTVSMRSVGCSISHQRMQALTFFLRHCTDASMSEQAGTQHACRKGEPGLLALHEQYLEHNLPHSHRALNSLYTRMAHHAMKCVQFTVLKRPHTGTYSAKISATVSHLKGKCLLSADIQFAKHFVVGYELSATINLSQHFSAISSTHHLMLQALNSSGSVTMNEKWRRDWSEGIIAALYLTGMRKKRESVKLASRASSVSITDLHLLS